LPLVAETPALKASTVLRYLDRAPINFDRDLREIARIDTSNSAYGTIPRTIGYDSIDTHVLRGLPTNIGVEATARQAHAAPSSCARMRSGLTCGPQSKATSMRGMTSSPLGRVRAIKLEAAPPPTVPTARSSAAVCSFQCATSPPSSSGASRISPPNNFRSSTRVFSVCARVAGKPLGDLAAVRFCRLRQHRKNPDRWFRAKPLLFQLPAFCLIPSRARG
jgi:hypothetical protein